MELKSRITYTFIEHKIEEAGQHAETPLRKVAVAAVLKNPYAGEYVEDLRPIIDASAALGAELSKIAVEARSDRPDFSMQKFADFAPQELTTDPDERTQIAFRLARRLGHKNVYGIDEQSDTIDYFPFDKVEAYAKAHNRAGALARSASSPPLPRRWYSPRCSR